MSFFWEGQAEGFFPPPPPREGVVVLGFGGFGLGPLSGFLELLGLLRGSRKPSRSCFSTWFSSFLNPGFTLRISKKPALTKDGCGGSVSGTPRADRKIRQMGEWLGSPDLPPKTDCIKPEDLMGQTCGSELEPQSGHHSRPIEFRCPPCFLAPEHHAAMRVILFSPR